MASTFTKIPYGNKRAVSIESSIGNEAAVDSNGNISVSVDQIDPTNNAVKQVSYSHAELHSGTHYKNKKTVSILQSATKNILIVTPNTTKWAHMIIEIGSSTSSVLVTLYEASTTSSNGTLLTSRNRNRNVADDNTTLVYEDPTITAVGDVICTSYLGTAGTVQSRMGGNSRDEEEIVLKQNTKYLVRIIEQGTSATNLTWSLDWYEHTNLA